MYQNKGFVSREVWVGKTCRRQSSSLSRRGFAFHRRTLLYASQAVRCGRNKHKEAGVKHFDEEQTLFTDCKYLCATKHREPDATAQVYRILHNCHVQLSHTLRDELAASARPAARVAPVLKMSVAPPVEATKPAAADCRSWQR